MPSTLYGSIERAVEMLVKELMERGHEVTLFANPELKCRCPSTSAQTILPDTGSVFTPS